MMIGSEKLSTLELYAVRWFLGLALSLISLLGLFTVDVGSKWIAGFGGVFLVITLFMPSVLKFIRLSRGIGTTILLLIISGDFMLSRGDLIPPLIRMVALLMLVRSLQLRSRREDLQLVLLSLFLIIICGVLSQDISFALQLLIYAPICMATLFAINLSDELDGADRLGVKELDSFRLKRILGKVYRLTDRKILLFGSGIFLLGIIVSSFMFVALPRFQIGQALPFLQLKSGQSLSGFTDRIEFGDLVDIQNDTRIAMRADVTDGYQPAVPYWRMAALDAYYEGGFQVSPSAKNTRIEFRSGKITSGNPVPLDQREIANEWTLYLEGGVSAYLPVVGEFQKMQFKNRQRIQITEATRVLLQKEINGNTLFYRMSEVYPVEYSAPSVSDIRLRNLSPTPVDTSSTLYLSKTNYPLTTLCYPNNPEVVELLETISKEIIDRDELSREEISDRIVSYLQRDRGYSLQVELPNTYDDKVVGWLAGSQPGHCELYASAFTLIARYCGLPTRIVSGFRGGDWNGFENYYMVRNANAHAWCEVYVEEKGWYRVDPTPGNSGDEISLAIATEQGRLSIDRTFKAYVDSLKILWFRRVVDFDQEDQQEMLVQAKGIGEKIWGYGFEKIKRIKASLLSQLTRTLDNKDWLSAIVFLVSFSMGLYLLFIFLRYVHKGITFGFKSKKNQLRSEAGRVLLKIKNSKQSISGANYHNLERIRFGDTRTWPKSPREEIKRAKAEWRRSNSR